MVDEWVEDPERFECEELAHLYIHFKYRLGNKIIIKPNGRNDPCVCGSNRKLKKCCGEFNLRRFNEINNALYERSNKEKV